MSIVAPPPPASRLCLGVTGHRSDNPMFAANEARVAAVLSGLFDAIDTIIAGEPGPTAPTRLHSMLANGVDQIAAHEALRRGWELTAPLPFGRGLSVAINAQPRTGDDARALLRGEAATDRDTETRAATIRGLNADARLFELAERDEDIATHFLAAKDAPDDLTKAQLFSMHSSERFALAGRVMIEQSDLIIGVWDGNTTALIGGTGHTIAIALDQGAAVIWIDPAAPEKWAILRAPESLAVPSIDMSETRMNLLAGLVRAALRPPDGGLRAGAATLGSEAWHPQSSLFWTAYRRIEALFGGGGRPFRSLRTSYESPVDIVSGSGAAILAAASALPGSDGELIKQIETDIFGRFAWSDGISTYLSDAYRGGMIANFILSASAVIIGIAYQPFGTSDQKWMFASVEFLLLCAILVIIWQGGRQRWHKRWFETRRVAEYLRHAPILLLFGVARPPGRWPQGSETAWPEYYARASQQALGLPRVAMTSAYLRAAVAGLLQPHIAGQRDYHHAKAARLTRVHHNLDALSTRLFQLAVVAVAIYLALSFAAWVDILPHKWPHKASYFFSFMGVVFPTLGAGIAGMRYFGDFERFAAISEVAAEKLDAVHARLLLLLSAPDPAITYARAAELAHAADEIVTSEIESWQSVFGGKAITVPV